MSRIITPDDEFTWMKDIEDRIKALENSKRVHAVPACRVEQSANVSVLNNNTTVGLTFDTVKLDTDNMRRDAGNPSRITINTPGEYLCSANMEFAANVTGQRQIWFISSGGGRFGDVQKADTEVSGTMGVILMSVTLLTFSAGDYLEVIPFQNSGGALNVITASFRPRMWAIWLGNG